MTDDWPQIKARLGDFLKFPHDGGLSHDIRAALQRVEELERQRVEGVVALCVCENAATPRPDCDCVTCTVKRADKRAEAAEAKLAPVVEAGQRCIEISTALASAGIVGHQNILDVMGAALAAARQDHE